MAFKNSNNYSYEVALGHVDRAGIVNKFGYNTDIDTAEEEIIASFGGAFNPTTDIISSAQTFTITYNNSTDGIGTTGALSLLFTYLDANFKEVSSVHVLSNTGSDTTSFSGLGINRVVVLSSGSLGYNANDITITATIDTTTQAQITAESSVTQQAIYHTGINKTVLLDFLKLSALRLSGGSSPRVNFRGYSWSRVTNTRYKIFDTEIDTEVENTFVLNPNQPFILTGREVIYFTADTNTNNTKVNCRFSGVIQDS